MINNKADLVPINRILMAMSNIVVLCDMPMTFWPRLPYSDQKYVMEVPFLKSENLFSYNKCVEKSKESIICN